MSRRGYWSSGRAGRPIRVKRSHVTAIAWSGANPGGRMRLPEREQGRRKRR